MDEPTAIGTVIKDGSDRLYVMVRDADNFDGKVIDIGQTWWRVESLDGFTWDKLPHPVEVVHEGYVEPK